jgi:hypothetical protein
VGKATSGLITGFVALVLAAGVSAAAPVDLYDAGPGRESVQLFGGVDVGTDLKRGTVYRASTFPVDIAVRPPDALWKGGQGQRETFRFVVLQHKLTRDAQGRVSVWGSGEIALSAGVGRTGSVAATVKRLRATRHTEAGEPSSVRVGGFSGVSFDTEVVGTDPGYEKPGTVFIPFTRVLPVGVVRPGRDHLFAREGQRLRIAVIGVRGKTVVIYIQPSDERLDRTFPAFVRSANRLLSTMKFPR